MESAFNSLNPYQSLEVIVSDSPQELVMDLKSLKTPVKIVAIVSYGTKAVAYITGDIRINTKKVKQKISKEK